MSTPPASLEDGDTTMRRPNAQASLRASRAEPSHTRDLGAILTTVAGLTSAQHALLRRVAAHETPVTISQLAKEADLHGSSVRETMDVLLDLGLVSREEIRSRGRGRPAQGYLTYMPANPEAPAQMASLLTRAGFAWLRDEVDDPETAARQIGRRWGIDSLAAAHVPDHTGRDTSAPGFSLVDHMDKIRLFLTANGMAATPDPACDTGLVLHSCPFTSPTSPDPLALELRRGMVEGVLAATAGLSVVYDYIPDPTEPVIARVRLRMRD